MEQKVNQVNQYQKEYGLNLTLAVFDLPKSTWYYHQKQKISFEDKYLYLKNDLFKAVRENSCYGKRRLVDELRETYGHRVNHKLMAKLSQCWGLSLIRAIKKPKSSGIAKAIKKAGSKANLVYPILEKETAGLRIINPFEICYTDFSEIIYDQGFKKAQFMPILDYKSKLVPGLALGPKDDTQLALTSWAVAKIKIEKLGFPIKGLILHSDQDPVYTGYSWQHQLLIKDKVRLSFSQAGARENPCMESFFGKFKQENKSLFLDCQTFKELKAVVGERVLYYNTERRHSSLGNKNPMQFVKNYLKDRTKLITK